MKQHSDDSTDLAEPLDLLGSASAIVRTHRDTLPIDQATTPLILASGETALVLPGGTVRVAFTSDADRLTLTGRVTDGRIEIASFGLRIEIDDWTTNGYVLLPAAAYAGNRFSPTGTWQAEKLADRGADPEIIQQPIVPRLEIGGGGMLQMNAGDMSVPAVALYHPKARRGLVLWTSQRAAGTDIDTVIRVVEDDGGKAIAVEILAAGVRQGMRRETRPSNDIGATWVAGDAIALNVGHRVFSASEPVELSRRLMDIRPRLRFQRPPSRTPLLRREMLPFAEAWRLQERKFNEQNWVQRYGYYSVGMREAASQDWQTGWVGGCNTMYALLADGDALTRRRALRTFDHLLSGRTPSGFIHDRFVEGRWISNPRVFLRNQADALYFLCKSLLLLRQRGEAIDERWLDLPRGVAEAFGRMWADEGQFGQYADAETGRIRIGRTCAAGLAPAGLLLAAELLDESRYAKVAVEAGRYYADRFTAAAMTNGGPGDIAQAHDSESAFALLASYTHLFEATQDSVWLDIARDAAGQAATYVMPYDFDFPTHSTFGRLGMRTTGTVFANVQNKHSAPGICTLSGVALLRLARATGERQWLDLLADIAAAIPQYMSRRDRPIPDIRRGAAWPVMPEGWINERINTSDWEVRGESESEIGVGEIFGGSTWSESAMLLTRVELPGVYVQPDRRWCIALDHVRASVDRDMLTIENPTPFDARVKLLIERDDQIVEPLGPCLLAGETGVEVPAHRTIHLPLETLS